MYTELENKKNTKAVEKNFAKASAIILVIVGSIILLVFVGNIWHKYTFGHDDLEIKMDATGQVGDFIAGVVGTLFSLAGVLLLFTTLREQRGAFEKERMENRFFEMITFHRDNVEAMKYSYLEVNRREVVQQVPLQRPAITIHTKEVSVSGRFLFERVYTEFNEVYNEMEILFEAIMPEDIYIQAYLADLMINQTYVKREIDYVQAAKMDIAYMIVFFGNNVHGANIITSLCEGRYQLRFLSDLLFYISLKPQIDSMYYGRWENIQILDHDDRRFIIEQIKQDRRRINEEFFEHAPFNFTFSNYPEDLYIPPVDNNYYKGHQQNLGHYYRNLFQAVKYIDEQKDLDYQEKYSYIKLLRAQFSTTEQAVFFLNSISIIGRIWEFEKRSKPSKTFKSNKQIITKYNLIKNIPFSLIAGDINVLHYYPDIAYEAITNNNVKERRDELKQQYY